MKKSEGPIAAGLLPDANCGQQNAEGEVPAGALPAEAETGGERVLYTMHFDRRNRRFWKTYPSLKSGGECVTIPHGMDVVAYIKKLESERDALRLVFAEASHNAGPAFVAHEDLSRCREDLVKEKEINRLHCVDWAENDTAIKAICAKHGIREDDIPGEFKRAVTCVEELEDMVANWKTWHEASRQGGEIIAQERDKAQAELTQCNAWLDFLATRYDANIGILHQTKMPLAPNLRAALAKLPKS